LLSTNQTANSYINCIHIPSRTLILAGVQQSQTANPPLSCNITYQALSFFRASYIYLFEIGQKFQMIETCNAAVWRGKSTRGIKCAGVPNEGAL
jgi:hypothetical protein